MIEILRIIGISLVVYFGMAIFAIIFYMFNKSLYKHIFKDKDE